jgi:hypothetical protein
VLVSSRVARERDAGVTFINTDGMSFIGPGSEWFWTAVSGIVLAVTFLAIYRQLRGQRAANAIDLKDRLRARWKSARMINVQLHLARALKADDDPDLDALAAMVANFFDELADLIERGYCDESAYEDYAVALLRWWTVMGPWVRKMREEYGPSERVGFERLAKRMKAALAAEGLPEIKDDPASNAARLDWMIQRFEVRLRLEREFGTV